MANNADEDAPKGKKMVAANLTLDAPTYSVDSVRIVAANPTSDTIKISFIEFGTDSAEGTPDFKFNVNLVMSKVVAKRLVARVEQSLRRLEDDDGEA